MKTHACPDRERLEEYVLGRLDAEGHGDLEEHLDACQGCRGLVATLDESSDLLLRRWSCKT